MKQTFILIFLFSLIFANFAVSKTTDTLGLYKTYVRITLNENTKLIKLFRKSINSAKKQDTSYYDALTKLHIQYLGEIKGLNHLQKFNPKQAVKQYQDAQLHNSLITRYYSKILDLAVKSNQPASAKNKCVKNAFYAQGKKKYSDRITNRKVLDDLHKINVSRLKQSQNFTYEKVPFNNVSLTSLKQSFKLKLPDNLQTNTFANNIFQTDKSGIFKKRKDDAVATNGFSNLLDSQNFKSKNRDSILSFKINPYRFRPFINRLKYGYDNQIKEGVTGKGILLTNVGRLTYLLHPKIVPVLALGFETQCAWVDKKLLLRGAAPIMRLGVETKINSFIGVFINYEKSWSKLLNNDGLVLGVTNSGGDKRYFNYWIGINTNNTLSGQGSPFVFRLGF